MRRNRLQAIFVTLWRAATGPAIRVLAPILIGLVLAGSVQAARISEVFTNPLVEDGHEFFEISGSPSESLSGLTLLVIEGDAEASTPGRIDGFYDLGSFSLGANGLFMRKDRPTPTLVPGPDGATTVQILDFSPNFENPTNTIVLVSGFTGGVGSDIDASNDGVIDTALPWTTTVDAIGVTDTSAVTDHLYGVALGFSDFVFTSAVGEPDIIFRDGVTHDWYQSSITGTGAGPFNFGTTADISGVTVTDPFVDPADPNTARDFVTAGSINGTTQVPEPISAGLVALAGFGLLCRRRIDLG